MKLTKRILAAGATSSLLAGTISVSAGASSMMRSSARLRWSSAPSVCTLAFVSRSRRVPRRAVRKETLFR